MDDDPKVIVRELVQGERKRLGLTQGALAAAVDVTQATVSNWEGGKTVPSAGEAARLAAALGKDPVELVGQLWSDVASLDRLAGIRERLANATDEDLAEVESWLDTRKEPKSAPRARRRPHTA